MESMDMVGSLDHFDFFCIIFGHQDLYCSSCGHQWEQNAKFCQKCGARSSTKNSPKRQTVGGGGELGGRRFFLGCFSFNSGSTL